MDKNRLIPGKRYLHVRQCMIDGILHEAERWIRCVDVTATGAVFSRDYEAPFELTGAQIARELREGHDR